MDARVGGITEGSSAGADLAHLSKAATHTNTVTTSRYNRDALSKSRKIAELRVISRGGERRVNTKLQQVSNASPTDRRHWLLSV